MTRTSKKPGGAAAGPRSQRQLRVGEEMRHALAAILREGHFRDPDLAGASITVTEVRVSPDLKAATAFVMPLAGEGRETVLAALKRAAPYLRARLAEHLSLRSAATLSFQLDTAFDTAERIEGLLHRPEVARDLGEG